MTAQFEKNVRAVDQGDEPETRNLDSRVAVTQASSANDASGGDGGGPDSCNAAGGGPAANGKSNVAVNAIIKINGAGPLVRVVGCGMRMPGGSMVSRKG